ncbi:hypothetical protein BTIS_0047 [Bifidobacterium tissieri]|uniref:Uncharacterized protein n=1 Tax=Bifidobacterium tissieri TaxID=1630162 RepID=A0A261FKI2_9BIFI|nr:hypothetical protein BTIS_0047 [Bifidobacterium tissieri]
MVGRQRARLDRLRLNMKKRPGLLQQARTQ